MAFKSNLRLQNTSLFVKKIAHEDIEVKLERLDSIEDRTGQTPTVYAVRRWDEKGVIHFYVAKVGKEVLVWYANGQMWISSGKNIESAIEGAMRDGWMYADTKVVS